MERHDRTLGGECTGQRRSDATTGAGDEHDTLGEPEVHTPSMLEQRDVQSRGCQPASNLEIPHGPACTFVTPGGHPLAIYQLTRPEVGDHDDDGATSEPRPRPPCMRSHRL
jgi:hypothetical protein